MLLERKYRRHTDYTCPPTLGCAVADRGRVSSRWLTRQGAIMKAVRSPALSYLFPLPSFRRLCQLEGVQEAGVGHSHGGDPEEVVW